MYVALKIWAMRTCDPPQPGINVCLKPFLNENTENVSLSQAKFPREVTYVYHEVSHELVQIDL